MYDCGRCCWFLVMFGFGPWAYLPMLDQCTCDCMGIILQYPTSIMVLKNHLHADIKIVYLTHILNHICQWASQGERIFALRELLVGSMPYLHHIHTRTICTKV